MQKACTQAQFIFIKLKSLVNTIVLYLTFKQVDWWYEGDTIIWWWYDCLLTGLHEVTLLGKMRIVKDLGLDGFVECVVLFEESFPRPWPCHCSACQPTESGDRRGSGEHTRTGRQRGRRSHTNCSYRAGRHGLQSCISPCTPSTASLECRSSMVTLNDNQHRWWKNIMKRMSLKCRAYLAPRTWVRSGRWSWGCWRAGRSPSPSSPPSLW